MRKFLIIILFFIPLSSFAQVDTAWVRLFNSGGTSPDEGYGSTIDNSGNLFITGASTYLYLNVKYQNNGNLHWYDSEEGRAYDVTTSSDGMIYMAGTHADDIMLVKYNPNGDTLWKRYHNGNDNNVDIGFLVKVDHQNNIVVTGFTHDGDGSVIILKYNPNGDKLWQCVFKGPYNQLTPHAVPKAIEIDNNNNIYLSGVIASSGGAPSLFLAKIFSTGDTAWLRHDPESRIGRDITLDLNGNVYTTGYFSTSTTYTMRTYKYDNNGNRQWVRIYGEDFPERGVFGTQVEIDNTGYLYATGIEEVHSSGVDNNYLRIIKYTLNGDTVWVKRGFVVREDNSMSRNINILKLDSLGGLYVSAFGKRSEEDSLSGIVTSKYSTSGEQVWIKYIPNNRLQSDYVCGLFVDNHDIYVAGTTVKTGVSLDLLAAKYYQTSISVLQQYSGMPEYYQLDQNYPNPFNPSTKIRFSLPKSGPVSLKVSDAVGKEVMTLLNDNIPAGNFEVEFDGSHLASGIYFYQLISNDFISVKKMVLLK